MTLACSSQVVAGAYYLKQIETSDRAQQRSILRIKKATLRNGAKVDLAIVKLDQPFQMTPFVQKIALVPKNFKAKRKSLNHYIQLIHLLTRLIASGLGSRVGEGQYDFPDHSTKNIGI